MSTNNRPPNRQGKSSLRKMLGTLTIAIMAQVGMTGCDTEPDRSSERCLVNGDYNCPGNGGTAGTSGGSSNNVGGSGGSNAGGTGAGNSTGGTGTAGSCNYPLANCGNNTACSNLATDNNNCGACGSICKGPTLCIQGVCTSNCVPSAEICDGKDNNCNGVADEGCECQTGMQRVCGSSTGSCTLGVENCDKGKWTGLCLGSTAPSAETCDNSDNNCNGVTDENCECAPGSTKPCGNTKGTCQQGVQSCGNDGKWETACVGEIGPSAEICDGKDNNCNGVTDEGCSCIVGSTQFCGSEFGECQSGVSTCLNGTWGPCEGDTGPSAEICDGKDNNCNGIADEGCSCVAGTTKVCGSAIGACTYGTQTCSANGKWDNNCVGETKPAQEICDGVDNDCNGTPDEGCQCVGTENRPCGPSLGECVQGVQTCNGGVWGACIGGTGPQSETCDNKDNDCNGLTDETCSCVQGQTKTCGSDIGACQAGITTCNAAGVWGACVGFTGPAPELCDGVDNDCNGIIDGPPCQCMNNSTQPCGSNMGECSQGTQTCVNGVWSSCSGYNGPTTELCDGLDNDCNGVTDETCACTTGSTRTCGSDVGACHKGVQTCVNGIWSTTCVGEVKPANAETCNFIDDDCNNVVDENCSCAPGSTRTCGSALGTCKMGTQTCLPAGIWDANCIGAVGPQTEVCDNLDNDCNGSPDDNGCQCHPGDSRPCGSDVGECQGGAQLCLPNGVWDSQCQNALGPSLEICDGLDNDCNGVADEFCQCTPGQMRACGSNLGACQMGIQSCAANGTWSPICVGEIVASPEVCDSIDNDCNGSTDEGCQCNTGNTRPCGSNLGECSEGTQTCVNGLWAGCAGNVGPTNETCDNKDNDCNGIIDDTCSCLDGAVRTCGNNVGACQLGNQTCISGVWGPCTGGVTPSAELCDSIDNDCNGVVDEYCSCTPGNTRTCGSAIGMCKLGQQTCLPAGVWDPNCVGQIVGTSEVCDGLDNDCNGVADEIGCQCKPGSSRPCGSDVGACQGGTQICLANGTWEPVCQNSIDATAEICDGIDNNCNGVADEFCQCTPGQMRACGSNIGTCNGGIQNCLAAGIWAPNCVGATLPSLEVCDGVDNDCNNSIDEGCSCLNGNSRTCGSNLGECSMGTQLCVGGLWAACQNNVGPSAEICDGLDNDCNGMPDEGCQCIAGQKRTCGSNVGACQLGIQTCAADGTWDPVCFGATLPSIEVCDGIDNDCNNSVDENCGCNTGDTRTCGSNAGECAMGTQACINGLWATCQNNVGPSTEICDSLDNDCNNTTDEGCQCTPGQQRPCGSNIGTCQGGTQNCLANGTWDAVCIGAIGPQPDICDGLDNDCNNSIDEGCSCLNGNSRTCGSNLGECSMGTQLCVGGLWAACQNNVGPNAEICDGLDNDCNGTPDEGCTCVNGMTRTCGSSIGACQPGVQTCIDGVWSAACVGAIVPANGEICDGVDNNCNNTTDEGCSCTNGATRTCGSNVGTCKLGVQTCVSGVWSATCLNAVMPSTEICDGLDNDCNGTPDEGCTCVNGNTRTCGSTIGACHPGVQTCINGKWDANCVGQVSPANGEACDGVDNNCNGVTDEGCTCTNGATRTCGSNVGTCELGVQTCVSGIWSAACVNEVVPTVEVCDGLDNDCNGTADEGCQCLPGSTRTCGSKLGTCQLGVQTCKANGTWNSICVGSTGPQPEACDGLDNDCNGVADEGCFCTNGSTRTCGSTIGACHVGVQTCVGGVWAPICVGAINPAPETCNLIDDDCNGVADDTFDKLNDASNCGNCGTICAVGKVCQNGVCSPLTKPRRKENNSIQGQVASSQSEQSDSFAPSAPQGQTKSGHTLLPATAGGFLLAIIVIIITKKSPISTRT